MKRFLSLALICVVLALSLAVPSYAAESDSSQWVNVLDYATADGDNTFNGPGSITVRYELGWGVPRGYVDMVFSATGSLAPTVSVDGNELTVVLIGTASSRIYRAYGPLTNRQSKYTDVTFTAGDTIVYYSIKSFRFLSGKVAYPDVGSVRVGTAFSTNAWSNMANSTSTAKSEFPVATQEELLTGSLWRAFVDLRSFNCEKYDSIAFYISVQLASIDSITVTQGTIPLPFTVSYVSVDGYDWIPSETMDGTSFAPVYLNPASSTHITIEVDLSNMDRDGDAPVIHIDGLYQPAVTQPYCQLESVTGFLSSSGMNPLYFWLQKIFSALSGDTSSGDQFKDDSEGLISDLDGLTSEMDSVDRPSMDSVNADFTSDISDTSVLLGSIFSEVTSVPWLSRLILASVTMGLIAYILYGKE